MAAMVALWTMLSTSSLEMVASTQRMTILIWVLTANAIQIGYDNDSFLLGWELVLLFIIINRFAGACLMNDLGSSFLLIE